jgi:hypothetical protein
VLGPFNRIDKGANFRGVNARQNRETVRPQALQNIGERSHGSRCGRPPSLNSRGNKRGNGRCSSGLSARAANCDLKKKGGKHGNVRRNAPPFARGRFSVALFQADLTEVRDLNPPICIEKDIARFQASVQQSEAVRKPKAEGDPCNCFRFRRRSPLGRRIREHFGQRTACRISPRNFQSPRRG